MVRICRAKRIELYINEDRLTATQVRQKLGCTDVLNAGLFNGSFKAVMPLRVNGRYISTDPWLYWGYGFDGAKIELTQEMAAYPNYIACVCLVRNGKAEKLLYNADMGGARQRTAMGLFPDGRLWLYCDAAKPRTPEQLQALAIEAGLDSAIMLDGGLSSQCDFDGAIVNGGRKVHNFLCIWEEEEPPNDWENGKKGKEDEPMKVYISPSSQPANLYVWAGTNEQIQCSEIAHYTAEALRRSGFIVKIGSTAKSHQGRVEESNAWGADIHLPIHTNAGGGHGPIVFVYSLTAERLKLARPVYDAINAIVPIPSQYGVQAKRLDEVIYSEGKCVYVEAAFHDNETEARWIVEHTRELGEAIAKGLCEGCGVTYVPAKKETQEEEKPQEGPVCPYCGGILRIEKVE